MSEDKPWSNSPIHGQLDKAGLSDGVAAGSRWSMHDYGTHWIKMKSEVTRLHELATELLQMVEEYHTCDWEEEPFTPDIDELRDRLANQ